MTFTSHRRNLQYAIFIIQAAIFLLGLSIYPFVDLIWMNLSKVGVRLSKLRLHLRDGPRGPGSASTTMPFLSYRLSFDAKIQDAVLFGTSLQIMNGHHQAQMFADEELHLLGGWRPEQYLCRRAIPLRHVPRKQGRK